MAFKFFAFFSLMIVVNSQHQNNFAHHSQPEQIYQSLLNFPHHDHQNVLQMSMQNYMQPNYQNYPQQSHQMHSQQPQMNYLQNPHMSYQNQQQLSYQQQPQHNYQQQQPQQNYQHQQQLLKNYIQKPQQQMIQKPYVHEAEHLPQPARLTSEPTQHPQQQHQEQQQHQVQEQEQQHKDQEQQHQDQEQQQKQIQQQEKMESQQNKQEQYQVVEKDSENEFLKSTESTKTPIEYNYNYSVHDDNTNDIKQHHEKALNGAIVGQYSLMDADGYRRIVDYTADDTNGFKAVVRREFVETPKISPIVQKSTPVPTQKMNAQPQYFSSPAPSMIPITEVSKPTPVPQQPYKQLISSPIVHEQKQHYQYSAPASTKHIIPTQHDLQFFSPPTRSVPVAEKYNDQNAMNQQQAHQQQVHQQQHQHPQQSHQQHQFFFHPVPAPVLEKYLAPAIQQQQYFSAPTSAPAQVNAPVTEYTSFENNHPYTEVSFVGPVSNYHY